MSSRPGILYSTFYVCIKNRLVLYKNLYVRFLSGSVYALLSSTHRVGMEERKF
jgi:hypothetical protein